MAGYLQDPNRTLLGSVGFAQNTLHQSTHLTIKNSNSLFMWSCGGFPFALLCGALFVMALAKALFLDFF